MMAKLTPGSHFLETKPTAQARSESSNIDIFLTQYNQTCIVGMVYVVPCYLDMIGPFEVNWIGLGHNINMKYTNVL